MAIAGEYKMGGFRIRLNSRPADFRVTREERSSLAAEWYLASDITYSREDSGEAMRAFEAHVTDAISLTSRSMFHSNDPNH